MAPVRINADDIQREMAKIRAQLHQEMRGVVDVATNAVDWRSYIRGRPWLAIGLAFTSGYLLVPRRTQPSTTIVQPVAVEGLNLQSTVRAEKPGRPSLMRWFLGAAGPVAARAAQTYALSYVENLLGNQQAGPSPGVSAPPESPGQAVRTQGRGFGTLG